MSYNLKKYGVDFGDLKQRISIYTISISADVIGGEIAEKTLWKTCWAKVEPQTERQTFAQHVSSDEQNLIIYMRHQVGVRKQMILQHDGGFYEIQSVKNIDSADQWLKILAAKCEDI